MSESNQTVVDVDDLNGQIMELRDLVAAITARCANMRGQIVKQTNENTRLQLQIVQLNQKLQEKENPRTREVRETTDEVLKKHNKGEHPQDKLM